MALDETTNLVIKLTAQNTTQAAFGQIQNSLGGLQSTLVKVGAAFASAFAIKDVIERTRVWGKELDNLVDVLGISGEEASRWNYQAKIVGTTADDIASSFSILANNIYSQGEAIAKGTSDFDKLGISVLDAKNQIRPMGDIVDDLRVKMRNLDGPSQAIIERQLFGRAGGRLHDFLTLTDHDIRQMDQDMKALGIEVTTGGVAAMEQMERQLNRLGIIFDIIKVQIGSALIPVLVNLGRYALPAVSGAFKVVGEAMRVPLSILKDVFERMRVFASDLKNGGVWTAITNLAKDLISEVGKILGNVGSWITENLPQWRAGIGQLWTGMVSWIKTVGWPTLVSFMETQVPAFANWIAKSLPEWTKNFAQLIEDFLKWFIGEGIPTIVGGLATAIPKIGGWLLSAIGWMSHVGIPAAWNTLTAIGTAILKGVVEGLGDLKTKIWNWIKEAIPAAQEIEDFIRSKFSGGSSGATSPAGGSTGPSGGVPPLTWPPTFGIPNLIENIPDIPISDIGKKISDLFPGYANGGYVPARPGGTIARVGEGGEGEWIVPSSKMGGSVTVNLSVGSVDDSSRIREISEQVASAIMRATGSSGNWRIARGTGLS